MPPVARPGGRGRLRSRGQRLLCVRLGTDHSRQCLAKPLVGGVRPREGLPDCQSRAITFARAGRVARHCSEVTDLRVSRRDGILESLVLRISGRQIPADPEGQTETLQGSRKIAGPAQAASERTVAVREVQARLCVQGVGLGTLPIEEDGLPIELRRRR